MNLPEPQAQEDRRVPCEVYSRVVGYLRPVDSWNLGKQQEFRERVTYGQEEVKQEVDRSGHEE